MDWEVSSDVQSDLWRRLLEFANLDLAIDAIVARHGVAKNDKDKSNYRKQANQIRVCILQAREFFAAARDSSLFTSPNHLYYGMLSLVSAIMLIRGTGEQSLDVLRNDRSNHHHGLDYKIGIGVKQASDKFQLLENSWIEVLSHGHFKNWYETLPDQEPVYTIVRNKSGNAQLVRLESVGGEKIKSHDSLIGQKYNILMLLQYIPELAGDLHRFGALQCACSRVDFEVDNTIPQHRKIIFRIHSMMGIGGLDSLLEKFRITAAHSEKLEIPAISDAGNACHVICKLPTDLNDVCFEYPHVRQGMDLNKIIFSNNNSLHEIAEGYMCGYSMSMLSRYYPDLWVTCLESHGKAAKIIERSIGLLINKFPLMALNHMCLEQIVVSHHRPPWIS